MTYTFNNICFIANEGSRTVLFKLAPDASVPYIDENGALQWTIPSESLQAARNLLSQRLTNADFREYFGNLLIADASTAFNIASDPNLIFP